MTSQNEKKILKILNKLKEINEPITITELAIAVGISPKHIGEYLNQLEKKDLIIKEISEKDKRIKFISLKPRKPLFFFKFGQRFLLHVRTRMVKKHFELFKNKIKILKIPLIEYYSYGYSMIISLEAEAMKDEYENENDSSKIPLAPKPEIRYERFYLFSKANLKELEALNYSIHIYSLKEIRDLRKEKEGKHQIYTSIQFGKQSVKLSLAGKQIPTPFIYFDYFILRLNEMLKIENTVKINLNEKRKVIKRDFKIKKKAFEFYCYIYNFERFKYENLKKKTSREGKKEREIKRELKKSFDDWRIETDKIMEEGKKTGDYCAPVYTDEELNELKKILAKDNRKLFDPKFHLLLIDTDFVNMNTRNPEFQEVAKKLKEQYYKDKGKLASFYKRKVS